jgi:hypothetical protein
MILNQEPFMKFSSQIKPISYLKGHTAEMVKAISESRQPMLITQNGEAKLVVMDVKTSPVKVTNSNLMQLTDPKAANFIKL